MATPIWRPKNCAIPHILRKKNLLRFFLFLFLGPGGQGESRSLLGLPPLLRAKRWKPGALRLRDLLSPAFPGLRLGELHAHCIVFAPPSRLCGRQPGSIFTLSQSTQERFIDILYDITEKRLKFSTFSTQSKGEETRLDALACPPGSLYGGRAEAPTCGRHFTSLNIQRTKTRTWKSSVENRSNSKFKCKRSWS